jgi:peptide/nickel transport system permease protein
MLGWKQLRHHRLAFVGGLLLVLLYTGSIFAEVFAPYSPLAVEQESSLLPPSTIYWRDQNGQWLGPHVYPTRQGPVDLETGERPLLLDRARPAGLRLWVQGSDYRWLGLIPSNRHLLGTVNLNPAVTAPPARWHILGTDDQGRDYFSRLFYGSRVSLFVGVVGILIAFPIGLIIGGLSGYLGGWVDAVLMRCAEVLMSIPGLYLLVSLAALFQANPFTQVPFSNAERFLIIVSITSLISWAGLARVIRGQVLSLRERDYVIAAKVAGAQAWHLLIRHILPQTTTYTIISATLAIPGFIAAESILSLIGLGIQQPDPSWGNMLSLATNAAIIVLQPWLVLAPTLLIMISSLSFNLLGDGLRDALDPRDRLRQLQRGISSQ